jgi:UPF0755 protein
VAALLLAAVLLVAACSNEAMLASYLEDNAHKLSVPVNNDGTPVRFEVAPGTPAKAIGAQLLAAGLISDERLFEAYVRVYDLATSLEAGAFLLSADMTIIEIAEALQHGRTLGAIVTLREGWRVEQNADYLAASNVFSDTVVITTTDTATHTSNITSPQAEVYRAVALAGMGEGIDTASFPFLATRPAGMSLEGYLFPDTYELEAEQPLALDLIKRQLQNFGAQVVPLYDTALAEGRTNLTLHDVITVASIVEREAVIPAERPAIARVYLNRIAANMRLEADPTVQYAMGWQEEAQQWWKTPVTLDEYSNVFSPYNTYLSSGLPPGPIAAPGLSSIRAVLNPDSHDYLYFVAIPDGTGAHVFAETFDEHLVNVQRYLRGGN